MNDQIADNIRSTEQAGEQTVTQADVQRMLAERDAHQAQQSEAQQMEAANRLVYEQVRGFGLDPASYAGQQLMLDALMNHQGDLAAAHTASQASQKAQAEQAVKEYLAVKQAEANGQGLTPNTGGVPGTKKDLLTMADAKSAMDNWLANQDR